jgi:hypothetical protein
MNAANCQREKETVVKKLVIVVLALFAAWFFATPYLTFRSIGSAIENKDAHALSQYVDFPALKESLKANLRAKMTETIARTHNNNPYGNVAGAVTSQLALQMIDPLLDAAMTPEAIAALLQGQGKAASGSGRQEEDHPLSSVFPRDDVEFSTGYESFNVFAITLKKKATGKELATFFLKRQGFSSWKVTSVKIPD